jgi:hypothetical protein
MNCSDIAEILDNRNVEQLGAAERQDVESHLAACPECARDWELHAAFCALTDMREPSGFMANCRALIRVGLSSRRGQRMRSRLVLIGVFAAIAAAAGMLAAGLIDTSAIHSEAAVSRQEHTASAGTLPPPRISPASELSQDGTAPKEMIPAVNSYTVSVQLVNEATGSAVPAVESFYTALLDNLRRVSGLKSIEDSSDRAPVGAADFELLVDGYGSTSSGKFTAWVTLNPPAGSVPSASVC